MSQVPRQPRVTGSTSTSRIWQKAVTQPSDARVLRWKRGRREVRVENLQTVRVVTVLQCVLYCERHHVELTMSAAFFA